LSQTSAQSKGGTKLGGRTSANRGKIDETQADNVVKRCGKKNKKEVITFLVKATRPRKEKKGEGKRVVTASLIRG